MDMMPDELTEEFAKAISEGNTEATIEYLKSLINRDVEIEIRVLPKYFKQEINIEPIIFQQEEAKNYMQPEVTLTPPAHEPRKAAYMNHSQIVNHKDVDIPEQFLSKSQFNPGLEIYGSNIPFQENQPMEIYDLPEPAQPDLNNHPPFLQNPPMQVPDLPEPAQPDLYNYPPFLQENPPMQVPDLPEPAQPDPYNYPPFLQENPVFIPKANIPPPYQNNEPPFLAPDPIPDLNAYAPHFQVPDPIPNINPVEIPHQDHIADFNPIPQDFNIPRNIEKNEDFRVVLDEEPQANENDFIPNKNVADLEEDELEVRKQKQAELKYSIARQLVEITGTDLQTALRISERVSSLEAAFQLFYG